MLTDTCTHWTEKKTEQKYDRNMGSSLSQTTKIKRDSKSAKRTQTK